MPMSVPIRTGPRFLEDALRAEIDQRELDGTSLVDHGQNWFSRSDRDPATADLCVRSGVTVHLGWLTTEQNGEPDSGIVWQLDAVLVDRPVRDTDPAAWRAGSEDGRIVTAGLLLRSCLTTPLDTIGLRGAYDYWLKGLLAAQSWRDWSPRTRLPTLAAIRRGFPAGFPTRGPSDLRIDDDIYARNALDLLAAARALVAASPGQELGDALVAYPFAREILIDQSCSPDSLVSGISRRSAAPDGLRRRRLSRRPPSASPPGLDGEIQLALGDGRKLKHVHGLDQVALDAVVATWGPLAARFAAELGGGLELSDPDDAVLAVRRRYALKSEPSASDWVRRRVEGLKRDTVKRLKRLQGRQDGGRAILRRTVPYLVADTRLAARPFAGRWLLKSQRPGDLGGLSRELFEPVLKSNIELLLEWLRTDSFLETLDVVCGGKREAFRSCVTPGSSFDDLRVQARGKFHHARVQDSIGDRWIAGFGDTVGDVVKRLSFAPEASAFQTWPTLR